MLHRCNPFLCLLILPFIFYGIKCRILWNGYSGGEIGKNENHNNKSGNNIGSDNGDRDISKKKRDAERRGELKAV